MSLPTGVYLISTTRFLLTLAMLAYLLLSVGDLSQNYDPIDSGLTLGVGVVLLVALVLDLLLFLGVRFRSVCLLGSWLPWCLVTLSVNLLAFWWTWDDPMYQREVTLMYGVIGLLSLVAVWQVHSFFTVVGLIREMKSPLPNRNRSATVSGSNAKEMKPLRQADA